ncbi:LOW QUALITY PROTEIN: chondroitin sulfate proteoglycan 4-like [Thalassophryne amazonica]|uniref:LOW QUALITY PROTEIN: chondroitin sulfate proteoglycan 4-like n=1 Tax=Thalassophryne amazonica TaxID=390379 RepID=UPI001471469C|nr:LOW QUALITY PROTEIN: chondroitin sulfate proteoglycan 4-like [Thalassophryne amazonica]
MGFLNLSQCDSTFKPWMALSYPSTVISTSFQLTPLLLCGQVDGVSFYGDGYIHLRAVQPSNQTRLHIRFRTSSPAGLLLFAAGHRDFLLLEVVSGRLQLRVDFGSGERSLQSEKRVILSDLAWHSAELIHDHHNVTMTVDRNSQTSLSMPGPDVELNIESGVFVGRVVGLNHASILKNSTGFRGCMDEVVFSEHNLLSTLRPFSGYKTVHAVGLGCSPQFSAAEGDSVTFYSSQAFISLPPWEVLEEGVFECEIHPSARQKDGVVLYSSAIDEGFIAIELRDGKMVATLGNGVGGKIQLRSSTHLHSSYTWYPVQLRLLPHSVQLKVGEESLDASLGEDFQVLQTKGPLLLGGLDDQAWNEVSRAGLLAEVVGKGEGGSFKGCLREIRLNARRTGLPQALITKDISVGCKTERIQVVTITSPTDVSELDVTTTQSISSNSSDDRKKNSNFVTLRKLDVPEGGRALLEPKHIKVNLDFRKLGIHPSEFIFRVEVPPVHGRLQLDRSPEPVRTKDKVEERSTIASVEEEGRTFSMLDLWQGRVLYIHGGSEDLLDFFMFSLFTTNKKELPVLLKGKRLYRFNIRITPVNDAPVLNLPEGNLFTLLQNSKRRLTTDILRVSDPDSSPADLMFRSLGNLNTEAGYLEHQDYPGRAISLFSLKDLEEGKISFVHTGDLTSRLVLSVSDGQKLSNTVVFRIMAVALEHKLVNNTGLEVDQGKAMVITSRNLAVQVNVADQAVEIRYDITVLPQYGELQRLHSSGDWKPTVSFSQKLLEKERIRYLSTYRGLQSQNNITDHFKSNVSIGSLATEKVVFCIVIRWIHFKVTRSKMEVNGVESAVITPKDLHAISKGAKLNESDIYFRLLTVPKKGRMFLSEKVLKKNSTLSQKNITDGLVKYDLLSRVYDDARDTFSFEVFSTHATSTSFDFRINIKAEPAAVTVTNKGLSVLEGGSKVITKDVLFTCTTSTREVQYTITTRPRHGQIRKINLSNSTSINDNIVTFDNQDIIEQRIMYIHDDSETKHDSFTFQISIYKRHKNNTRKDEKTETNTFNISIQLVNDQRPVRVIDKVFRVARDGQKLLTLDDLRYQDDDVDFDDSWLVYTRRGIPMGELVLVNDTSHKLYEFTQQDIQQKKVLFIHRGVSFGRFVLFVSDGKHYVSTLLEVVAQDPFLQVENNTGILVQQGGITTLTSGNLSVFTNLDIREPQEVTFEVFLPPKHGVLCFIDGDRDTVTETDAITVFSQQDGNKDQPTTSFTQQDVNQGLVIYHQQVAGSTNDSILLEATNGVTEVSPIRLDIDVIPILLPLQVPNLTLDEGSSLPLTLNNIQVANHHFSQMNFLYRVIIPPRYGHLEHSRIPGMPITAFTQSEVEHEYISYIHDGSDTLRDNFIIVANQTEIRKHSLPGTININITPVNDETPVVTANKGLKVWVGSVTEISTNDLSAEDLDTPPGGLEFIVTPPSNGHLALKSAPSRHILNFTQNHIQTGQLVFVHSGALSGGFHFQVNDGVNFAPRQIFSTTANSLVITLQRNKQVEVYPGSMTPITEEELQVVTNDVSDIRRNHSIVFAVTAAPKLGRLVQRLHDNSTRTVSTFTQRMVNDGVVLYDQNKPESVEWSASDSFSFTVSSPPAFLPLHTFTILISYQASEHQDLLHHRTRLLSNAGAVVAEGGSVMIDTSKLDATNLLGKVPQPKRQDHQILYRVISLPRYGVLSIQGRNISRDQPDFSQLALNKFGVTYVHDDSETTNDSFTFRAWVAPLEYSSSSSSPLSAFSSDSSFPPRYSASSSSLSSLHPASHLVKDSLAMTDIFNITVTPVNDQPTLIRSRNPSMKIVVGERVVLGPENLQVEDHDTPPEELHYIVVSKPNSGYLTLGARPEPVTSFTQYDVNHRRLHFIQQGEPSTGVFYFNITDGHHHPLYKLFSLEVIEPVVSMENNTGLSLVQGRAAVVLTTNQLAAQTNGRTRATITYTVTAHPRHGRIAINDQEVMSFTHEDLQSGRVVYHMTDLSESQDSFQISVSASSPGVDYRKIMGQTVQVTVRPLIYLREPVRVPSGIAVKLGKAMMDASELARITRTDPVFEVLSPPKHGKLVKMTYDPNRASEVLKSFTFRDVVQGRVAIEETLSDGTDQQLLGNKSAVTTGQGHTPATPLNDSFIFLLKAGNVQPAKGELHFTILPHHQMRYGPRGTNKADGASRERTAVRQPAHNWTTTVGGVKAGGRGGSTVHSGLGASLHPHILSHKHHNRTQHKTRAHNRWTNHTRTGSHGVRSGSSLDGPGNVHVPQLHTPSASVKNGPANSPDSHLLHVEVVPRPASDPLLIILPLLACLLLIVILIILILVSRHRKEKQARLHLIQELAAVPVPSEDSPYLGRPERSVAMPSVVVTPLGSASCPSSPVVHLSPRRRSLAPGMTFWGPFESDGASVDGGITHRNRNETRSGDPSAGAKALGAAEHKTAPTPRSPAPTLKNNQYWV